MNVPDGTAEQLQLPYEKSVQGLNQGNGIGGGTLFRHAGNFALDLGGITIPPVPVQVSLQPAEGPQAPVIFVGHRILRDYRVTFDLDGKKLILEE